ncbi:unnamed protein product, partial [marine sediment metagenome]
SMIWIIVIILLVTSYKSDIETCKYIVTHPLTYCEQSNACKIIEEQRTINPYGELDISNIPEFNIMG